MKTVITYGTYDLLHQGHINLLRRAKELGDYLIVGVTNDSFDRDRGKLNVRNNVLERVEAVKATGYADKIIIEDYVGQKIDDIQKYNVDIFAIGSDWEGKFEVLLKFWYIYVSKFEETFICKREIDALPPIIRFAVFILLTEPSRIPLFNLLAIELLMAE